MDENPHPEVAAAGEIPPAAPHEDVLPGDVREGSFGFGKAKFEGKNVDGHEKDWNEAIQEYHANKWEIWHYYGPIFQ